MLKNKNKYTFAETFVGAGGSHQGFKQTDNFKTVFVTDIEEDMLKTLSYNNPEIPKEAVVKNDIYDVSGEEILKISGLEKGDLDVLFGGIVCKGFSMAGIRDPTDNRNTFYVKQLELVKSLMPKVSIIENVPGILSMHILNGGLDEKIRNEGKEAWKSLLRMKELSKSLRKEGSLQKSLMSELNNLRKNEKRLSERLRMSSIKVIDDIKRRYEKMGYDVYIETLSAANYGAATSRKRVLIVAVRKDLGVKFEWPEITHVNMKEIDLNNFVGKKSKLKPFVTVNDALSMIDYSDKSDKDNISMNHKEKTVERFKYAKEGDSLADIELPKNLKISKFYSRGATKRLEGNKPAFTLVPGHSNFPIHPKEHRSITIREGAVIMGFPLNYKFFGSHTQRCYQVGNAVAVPMTKAIAESVIELLNKYYSKNS